MPIYKVLIQAGLLNSDTKAALATQLTALHSEYHSCPKSSVHVIIQEYAPGSAFTAGEPATTVSLMLLIRLGHTPDYKRKLLTQIWQLLRAATGVSDNQIVIGIQEAAPSQAMEFSSMLGTPCWRTGEHDHLTET